MKKNILFFILLLILFAGGGFFLLELHSNNHGNQENRRNIARATPPPTLPLVKTSAGDSNTKKISFQSFTVSFLVPSDLKILKEVDPTSEDTQIGSNYIALYTPDTVIDPKKHVQTAGAKLSINIVNTKKDFTSEKDIVPATSIKEAATDLSVIPANNALLNKQDMKIYLFPSDKSATPSAWVYNAEALIKNGGNRIDITFYCADYSNSQGSPACHKLLKEILPTMDILAQPTQKAKSAFR